MSSIGKMRYGIGDGPFDQKSFKTFPALRQFTCKRNGRKRGATRSMKRKGGRRVQG